MKKMIKIGMMVFQMPLTTKDDKTSGVFAEEVDLDRYGDGRL